MGQVTLDFTKDIIIPVFAVLISIAAVIFTAWSLYIQREHNKKSIKPIGKIRVGDYETNIYVRIDNSGIGPLILLKVFVNGEEVTENKMVLDYLPDNVVERIRWKNFTNNYKNRTIPVGENLELIRWTPSSDYEKSDEEIFEAKKDIRNSLKNLNLKIEYTDIYGRKTFNDELELSWFGRNEGKKAHSNK